MAYVGVIYCSVAPGARSGGQEEQSKKEGELQSECIIELTTAIGD